jgi:hypothetical protein
VIKICPYCGKTHDENELCGYLKKDLYDNPFLLSQAADFTSVAGQYRLTTSQDIANATRKINQIPGTSFREIEGSHQVTRDIQVIKRLKEELFSRSGVFQNPETAKQYLENATPDQLENLYAKLSGAGQEVDWLREQQGKIRSLWTKSRLFNGNAPGVDGETVNRLTGDTISRTTIKAAQGPGGLNTNVQGVIKALKNGTLDPHDTVLGVKGIKDALLKKLDKEIAHALKIGDTELAQKLSEAKKCLIIEELNTPAGVNESVNRLKDKIAGGEASAVITAEHVWKQAAQGAVIGAAIGLTVSSITSYLRYRKGETTREEAFVEIGEGTVKSTLTGGAMAGITLFLPAGPIGFMAGMAIGVYLNAALTNVLDEIFGKGAYREILIADRYIVGTSQCLVDALHEFKSDREFIQETNTRTVNKSRYTEELLRSFDNKK